MNFFLGAVIALFLLSLNSSSGRITISNSTNERFITFGNEKLKVSLDYNLRCVITKLEVNGEPVILNKFTEPLNKDLKDMVAFQKRLVKYADHDALDN